jgi:Short C-terminal domain
MNGSTPIDAVGATARNMLKDARKDFMTMFAVRHRSTRKPMRSIAITAVFTLLPAVSAVGAGTSLVIIGQTRPAIQAGSVKVYLTPPERFEQIAIIEATSETSFSVTAQGKMDKVMERLKEQAARVGANGLLLQSTGAVSGGSVSTGNANATAYGNTAYGTGTGVSIPVTHKAGSAIAIFVEADLASTTDASQLLKHGAGTWTDAFGPADNLLKQWERLVVQRVSRFPDFNVVVFVPDLKVSRDMLWHMAGTTRAADIAYYLGTHKAEAAAIYEMTEPESRTAMRAIEQKAPLGTPAPLVVAAPTSKPFRDVYTELLKLDELRTKGILTQDEFEAQKKKLLAGE